MDLKATFMECCNRNLLFPWFVAKCLLFLKLAIGTGSFLGYPLSLALCLGGRLRGAKAIVYKSVTRKI